MVAPTTVSNTVKRLIAQVLLTAGGVLLANPTKLTITKPTPAFDVFFTGLVPEIGSRISYDHTLEERLAKPNSRLYNFYGGTGATNSSALHSMKDLVRRLHIKEGHFGVIWDNPMGLDPIEFGLDISREKWTHSQGNLSVQENFMVRSLAHSMAAAPENVSHNVISRSTSTAVMFQLLHDYILSGRHESVIGRLDTIIASGLLGHLPDEVDRWVPKELAQLNQEKRLDLLAHQQDRRLFSRMSFAPTVEWPSPVTLTDPKRFATTRRLPKLYVFLGSADPMATELEQLEVLRRFAILHPDLSITAFIFPGGHDPSHGEKTTGWTTKHGLNMFSKIASEGDLRFGRSPGLELVFHPRYLNSPTQCSEVILATGRQVANQQFLWRNRTSIKNLHLPPGDFF
jgi:hypothetical protein